MLNDAMKKRLKILFCQIVIPVLSISHYLIYRNETADFFYGMAQGYLVMPLIILSPFFKTALFYSTINSGTNYLVGVAVGAFIWAILLVISGWKRHN